MPKGGVEMKKSVVSLFLLVLIVIMNFVGCTESENFGDVKNRMTYYTSNDSDDFCDLIKIYNNYCLQNYDKSYQIAVLKFASEDEINTKLSTELMAGKGPDIISINQKLPFEKLLNNGTFLDVNKLCDNNTQADKIDFNNFNSAIMKCGIYNGKRYIVPLFYGTDVFVSTQEKLKKFNISCDNHTVLTYKNLSEKFSLFSNEKANFGFISGYNDTNSMFNYPMHLFNRFINNYVDFENKVTYFESDDFKSKLDTMCRLLNASKEDFPDFIFDDLYINRSLSLMVRKYAYYKSENETPVICRGLVKSDNDYSAFVQVGFGINSNTHFEKQAYAFLKFALSEDVQTKMCGAKGISYSANISFPVNKKAFEQAKYSASKQADDDGKIIGIDNDFMQTYINAIEKINNCSLYMNVLDSYYNSSVIGDITRKFLNGDISKDKFIRQLSAATKIYLTE